MNKKINNVLFVCTGNTCRSPMAAGIFNKMAAERHMAVTASSAGIYAGEGQAASENAVKVCAEKGIDLTGHRARQLNDELINQSGLIVPLSLSHRRQLENYNVAGGKIFKGGMSISDPFMGDISVYKKCFSEIEALCETVLKTLL